MTRSLPSSPRLARFTLLAACLAWLLPSAAAAGDVEAGQKTYDMLCTTCHGATGKGDGPGGAALQPPPRDFSQGDFKFDADGDGTVGSDEDLKLVITNGAMAYGGSPLMTPWGGAISDDDIANVIALIRSLKE